MEKLKNISLIKINYYNNLLLICILFGFTAHSQWIDNNLEYLNSFPKNYWLNKPLFFRSEKFWLKYYKEVSKFPTINVDAAIMLKETDSCERYMYSNKLNCDRQENSIKYVPKSTFYYHLSHAMSIEVKSGELYRFIAFRIDSLPPIGDTATFEFLLLNNFKEIELDYVLDVYFSKELKLGKLFKIKNDLFANGQLVNETAEIGHGFEVGKTKLKIDENTSKYKWLILVCPVRVSSRGYILPRNLTLNEQIEIEPIIEQKKNKKANFFVQFDVNSYLLNENEKNTLHQILDTTNFEAIKKITLQGQADNSGNFTQNVFLAFQRSEAIKAFFIQNGVDEKLIKIETPSYENDPKNKFSRGCKIEFEISE